MSHTLLRRRQPGRTGAARSTNETIMGSSGREALPDIMHPRHATFQTPCACLPACTGRGENIAPEAVNTPAPPVTKPANRTDAFQKRELSLVDKALPWRGTGRRRHPKPCMATNTRNCPCAGAVLTQIACRELRQATSRRGRCRGRWRSNVVFSGRGQEATSRRTATRHWACTEPCTSLGARESIP